MVRAFVLERLIQRELPVEPQSQDPGDREPRQQPKTGELPLDPALHLASLEEWIDRSA